MKGRLIVIDGLNGSGKQSQTEMLVSRLNAEGILAKRVDFPQYDSESGKLVKRYLSGEFGENVNPYLGSLPYAIDRKMSAENEMIRCLNDGYVIVCDRYVSSNMIHQSSYFDTKEKQDEYLDWITNFEYKFMKLPQPDMTVYLQVDPTITINLMKDREELDMHEKNVAYIHTCYEMAQYVANKYNWTTINCVDNSVNGDIPQMKTKQDINDELYNKIKGLLK
jgi:dTMP kinase